MFHTISRFLFIAICPSLVLAMPPDPFELFDTRNFCVLCTFNDMTLSPETLRSEAHTNANISASYMYNTVIDELDLTFGFLYAIKGEHFTIKNSKTKMLNISYSDLPYFTFSNNKDSLYVNFMGSNLSYANFQNAHLEASIFSGGALVKADFTQAKLPYAAFDATWLDNTNFTDAQLEYANFTGADINNTNFTRANLHHAIITEEQLKQAILCDTILPDGTHTECT